MGGTNYGTQTIIYNYKYPAKGRDFSKTFRGILKPGIYSGLTITKTGNNTVSIAVGIAVINTSTDKTVIIKTSVAFTVTVVEATPVIYAKFDWVDSTGNYADFLTRADGSSVTNEIVLGKCNFSGGVITTIDYTDKTYGLTDSNFNLYADEINVDTINEKTTDSGINIDGAIIKDHNFYGSLLNPVSITTNSTLGINTQNYINGTDRIELTLPVTSAIGDRILINDIGSRGWKILQNANQYIIWMNQKTIPGTTGYIESKTGYASVEMICVEANVSWQCINLNDYPQMKGYYIGGNAGGYTNVIEDLIFSNEISQTISATLDTAKTYSTGISSNLKGYIIGGEISGPTFIDVIEDLIFNNETSQAISATLDTAKVIPAGVSSNLKGYIMGGAISGPTYIDVIEDLIFSNETSQAISATLDTGKTGTVGISSNLKGYMMGGYLGAVYTDVIEDLIFSNETSQAISATLDTVKSNSSTVSSNLKGYCMGGSVVGPGFYTNVIEDLIFSNETSQTISATLNANKSEAVGISSNLKGYGMGGQTSGPTYIDVIEDLIFSNETSQAISATLDTGKSLGAGVQGYN